MELASLNSISSHSFQSPRYQGLKALTKMSNSSQCIKKNSYSTQLKLCAFAYAMFTLSDTFLQNKKKGKSYIFSPSFLLLKESQGKVELKLVTSFCFVTITAFFCQYYLWDSFQYFMQSHPVEFCVQSKVQCGTLQAPVSISIPHHTYTFPEAHL